VFCGLPEEVQPVVLRRIAKLQAVGPDVLDRLQRSLPVEVGASARDWPKTGGPKIGGLDRVTQILRRMDDPTAWDRLSREVFPAA
jgi:flagellar motor switch protein FliG